MGSFELHVMPCAPGAHPRGDLCQNALHIPPTSSGSKLYSHKRAAARLPKKQDSTPLDTCRGHNRQFIVNTDRNGPCLVFPDSDCAESFGEALRDLERSAAECRHMADMCRLLLTEEMTDDFNLNPFQFLA